MKVSGLYIPYLSFHQISTKRTVPMTILQLVIPMDKACFASVWTLPNQPTKLDFKWCTISPLLIPFMFQNGLTPTSTNFWQVRQGRSSSKRLHFTGYGFFCNAIFFFQPWQHVLISQKFQFKSQKGVTFTSFAKTEKFGKDLYADYVAPSLNMNLMVETWPNGPGKMNSSCDKPCKVLNIDHLDFKDDVKPLIDFKTKKDHSKWAISYEKKIKGK